MAKKKNGSRAGSASASVTASRASTAPSTKTLAHALQSAFDQRPAALIFAFALLVRLIFLWTIRNFPTFDDPIIDSATYHRAALQLATDGSFDNVFFFQPILYPMWLAFQYWVLGPSMLAAKLIQITVGALGCSLLYSLARTYSSERLARLAGFSLALYAPVIELETELLATSYEVCIMLVCLTAFARFRAHSMPSKRLVFACGGLAAMAILWRATYTPLIAVWSLIFAWDLAMRRQALGTAWFCKRAGAYALGLSLPLLLISCLFHLGDGRFSFVPFSGGINFYLGNSEDYCSTINIRPGSQWEKVQKEPLAHGAVTSAEQMSYFTRKTLQIIADDPLTLLRNLQAKTLRLLSSRELPRITDPYRYNETSWLSRLLLWRWGPFGFPSGLILAFAFIGLAVVWSQLSAYLRAAVIVYPISVMLVFVAARFRMPVMPLLLWLAICGVAAMIRAIRARAWSKVGLMTINPLLLTVLTYYNPLFCEEEFNYQAEMHYTLGTNSEQRGLPQVALTRYREALRLEPSNLNARNNLALILARQGKNAEAIAEFETGLGFRREPKLLHSYSQVLAGQAGSETQVESLLTEAVAAYPDYEEAWISLGRFRQGRQQWPEAVAAYKQAIAANPLSAIAHNNLGVTLASIGKTQEAVASFRQATKLNPAYGEAYFNWALAYEQLGQSEDAKQLLEKLSSTPGPLQMRARERLQKFSDKRDDGSRSGATPKP